MDNHDCEAVHTKVEWCLVLYVFITLFYSIASLLSQQWSEYKLFEITNSDNLKVIFLKQEYAFSFALNKVFVAARKHNTKRNKTGFIMCVCESPPLNSLVKKIDVMFYCVNLKTLNKIYEKKIVVLVLWNQH